MSTRTFDELAGHGIPVTDGLRAIYNRAAAAWDPKPIVFDLDYQQPGSNGGMRNYEDRIQIWLNREAPDPTGTLIHELAHAVLARDGGGARIAADRLGGSVRKILSDLINITEHGRVHAIMADYGVDVAAENGQRSKDFLRDIANAPLDRNGNNLHLSVGYAMMLTVHRVEELVPAIRRAMHGKSENVARFGEALAEYVASDRNTTAYEDAQALLRIADVRPDLRAHVLSDEEFRDRYGWA